VLRTILFLAVTLSALTLGGAQTKVDFAKAAKSPPPVPAVGESTGRLPVKRVVLYKNGVGYFEHSTRGHGNQDLKALKGSSEEKALLQRYTRQLDSQEDRLNTLSKEISDLQEKRTREQEKLDRMVQEITLDHNL
jgi:hypothetical protein